MKNLTKQALTTLKNVAELETTLFNAAKAILYDPQNYHIDKDNRLDSWDVKTLKQAIPAAVQLVELTGESPYRHLQAIFERTDPSHGLLYPFTKIKEQPRTRIEEIFNVAQLMFETVKPLDLAAAIAELEQL